MGSITEISILHHVAIVLGMLWLLSYFNRCHTVAYFISLVYLYLVHERYVMRLWKKLQYEERKQSNQRRVLSDSETVRWLNHAVERIWPICMEQIASQKILLPIIPWFLEKYKPWTAKKAMVQHLYLGRNPPLFTEIRVLRHSNDDDHLVLELGMNFLTADDMSSILAVKLRKRLGFGMWARLHLTGMHIEGKILVGVKFLRKWPFLGRVRLCFAEPPYFQMTVKPMFTHGLDVTELPGIAGWLDKLLAIAFEQTLVEPNMLVIDMEKFASQHEENWFSVNEKEPIAYAKVEVLEASEMNPSDFNGLADPYVKGHLGAYRFRTKTQKKTLAPKWHEEFKIPIITWESTNVLNMEVRDKDHFVDDTLGDCKIDISDLRDGQRHDIWLPLENIKIGRLHVAITVLEINRKDTDNPSSDKTFEKDEVQTSFANDGENKSSFSSTPSEKSPRVPDSFEPINIEGQQETGIWVHQPGSEVSQTWEPRKGKSRSIENEIRNVENDTSNRRVSMSNNSTTSSSSSDGETHEGKNRIRRGLKKFGSMFRKSLKRKDQSSRTPEDIRSPRPNVKAVNVKDMGVKLIVEDCLAEPSSVKFSEKSPSPERNNSSDSPRYVKGMAKSILRRAEKSARQIKHAITPKGSRESQGDAQRDISLESDSSEDESLSTPEIERISVVAANPIPSCSGSDESCNAENIVSSSHPKEPVISTKETIKMEKDSPELTGDNNGMSNSPRLDEEKVDSPGGKLLNAVLGNDNANESKTGI